NKVGSLLFGDALSVLGVGPGAADGLAAAPVLFPGMSGDGNASLTVSGSVAPGGSSPRARAASAQLLLQGSSPVRNLTPFTIALAETAAGKQLLGAHHPALRLVASAVFKPRASSSNKHPVPVTAKRQFTIPAA